MYTFPNGIEFTKLLPLGDMRRNFVSGSSFPNLQVADILFILATFTRLLFPKDFHHSLFPEPSPPTSIH
jgi:hypothetical protein